MRRLLKSIFAINAYSISFCTTLLIVALFLIGIPIFDLVELKTYDLRFKSRGYREPSSPVVLAVIDEKSLDVEGRWQSWPRSKFGQLIDVVSEDGAKVIGFDIGFLEPDQNSYNNFIQELDQKIDTLNIKNTELKGFIKDNKLKADKDLILANAIKNSSATVILGYFFHLKEDESDYQIDEDEIDRQMVRIAPSKYRLHWYEDRSLKMSRFIEAYAPESNLEIYSKATEFSGYFNMLPDDDGVLRWMPLLIQCREDAYPPLSLMCAWAYLERPPLMLKIAKYGVEGIQMGKQLLPTDEKGRMLINYLGPAKMFPHISISDILHGKLPKGTFKDKIVLVGATAVGLYDLRSTPFTPVYPGLEIHATIIDNILGKKFLRKPDWMRIYDLLAIIILGTLTCIALPRLTAVQGIFFVSGLFIFHLFVAQLLFVKSGLWMNTVYPLLALLLTYTSLTVYHYVTEERERKKIKGAFSYYVSSSVVNEMLKHPEQLKLGGDKKDLTVLFSDIRGFTTISEGLSPEELVHLLNDYLTVMTDVVFKYDGTLDKYMGDAIMAIYGAPLEQENHAANACHSALEMMKELKRLNKKWLSQGKQPLDIGIGINSDMMMVGNMGSAQRFDYTVMGDAVNLGSRLEGANKNYSTHILISESTYERVKDEFVCMEVDSVRVKGKTRPVKIYQLLAHGRISEEQDKAVFYFQRGLEYYKQRKWDDAIKLFKAVKEMDKGLRVAQTYIQRSQDLKANPPPSDWDGVFTMSTK